MSVKRGKTGLYISRTLIYIFLIIITLICIVPIWILIVNATRSTVEIQNGISFIPSTYMSDNWRVLTGKGFSVMQGFINSGIISVSATLLTVYFSLLAAYAIEVYDFKLKKFVYTLVLILVMIPAQVSIIGFYQYMSILNLLNTYVPLILPAIAAPSSVFFAKQYLESCMIKELILAGRVDGCSELGIFHKIMLPIAAPGAFTMGIFAFVASWNNFFTPSLILTDQKKYTLPMLVKLLRGNPYKVEYGAIYLGLAVCIVPVIILYAILSRYIVSGIAMGAVKE